MENVDHALSITHCVIYGRAKILIRIHPFGADTFFIHTRNAQRA